MCIRGSHITSPCGRLTLLYPREHRQRCVAHQDAAQSELQVGHVACGMQGLWATPHSAGAETGALGRGLGQRKGRLALDGRWVEGRMGVGGGEQQDRQRGPNKLCGRSLKPLYRCCLSNSALCSLLSVCLCNRNPRCPLFPSQRLPPRPPSAVVPEPRSIYIPVTPLRDSFLAGIRSTSTISLVGVGKMRDFLIAMSGVRRRKSDPSFLFQAA
jgi:hypothetical protein